MTSNDMASNDNGDFGFDNSPLDDDQTGDSVDDAGFGADEGIGDGTGMGEGNGNAGQSSDDSPAE
ncbi:hypothetical protein [Mycetocola miduiensis]|uniref:Uncharacterized protein n=1 Tax=Mycetocola miduiensis TaxID=995034 RepID=A0A1I4Z3U3_9MICO|nr:hypothetical protein [Mycetocola miduiensis]SFN44954.1 hypothetical protein SAMN05216219_0719 [Mycetocola miduiensis]